MPVADHHDRPQWPVPQLVTLSAAVCLSVTTELLPTGVLPRMSRDLSVSEGTVGLLVTVYAVMVALFAAPLAMATAAARRRRLMCLTLLGYSASNALMLASGDYTVALVARIVGGAMHGLFWGMLGGYVARIVPADRLGRALTITSAGGVLAILLVVPAGTALSALIGWRGSFGLIAGLGVVATLVAARVLPDLPGRPSRERHRMWAVFRAPGLVGLVTTTAVVILGHFSFYTYIAPFLLRAGIPEGRLGLALLLYGAAGAVGLLGAGLVIDRHLRGAMIASMAALAGAYTLLGVVGTITVLAAAVTAVTGLVLGCLPIFMQAAVIRIAPHAAETASAMNASAFNIGIAGGALLGGLIVDHLGTGAITWLAAAFTLGGLGAMLLDRRVGLSAAVVVAPRTSPA
jgi:predicted MFS family arabinose efflux permease